MKKRKVDIRISSKMANYVCKFYQTDRPSKAIHKCIVDTVLKHAMHTQNKRSLTPEQTLELTEQDKTPKDKRISVYTHYEAIEFLRAYYCSKAYITDAVTIRCCIYDVLKGTVTDWKLQDNDKIFYMIGQKNPLMHGFLNECFEDIHSIYRIDGYAEPFTGTANVLMHTKESDVEFINDNSIDLINLLRVLRDYPYELKTTLIALEADEATFNNLNITLQEPFFLKAPRSALIQRATAFYFCRYASHYGKGESYRKISSESYMRKLDSIYPLSQRLQGIDIKKSDALHFSKTLAKSAENFLIYFDAPYIYSEEHYKQNNAKHHTFTSHIALRNRVQELRTHHICILSYRITASKSMKQKSIRDAVLQQKLDSLYLNRGFYYKLKQFDKKKGQIEILLSTVPFVESHPYTSPLTEMGVN